MEIKSPRGTKDILPQEVGLYQEIERFARLIFTIYGYREIRTPLFEETHLFSRSLGKSSEIVRKQMFSVVSQGDKSLSLRPEATAPIIRAFLEHNLDKKASFNKFYYIGPMFRAERPQKGRLRQFHHIGCEALGSSSPYLDVEVISLCINILQGLEIKDFKLFINNLGCRGDIKSFSNELKQKLKNKLSHLCTMCKDRLKHNPLRILDCKNKTCIQIVKDSWPDIEYLCSACQDKFDKVKEALALLNIKYVIAANLVRGLDYYTGTVFEITHPNLGAQDAIAAGGRYDNLAGEFRKVDVPAVGFAIGFERLILSLDNNKRDKISKPDNIDVYIASIGQEGYHKGFVILDQLRKQAISAEIDYESKSLKSQMRTADKLGVRFVVVIGEEELANNSVTLKDMQKGSQDKIDLENFYKIINQKLQK